MEHCIRTSIFLDKIFDNINLDFFYLTKENLYLASHLIPVLPFFRQR